MSTLRFLTANESYSPCLTVIIERFPVVMSIDFKAILMRSLPSVKVKSHKEVLAGRVRNGCFSVPAAFIAAKSMAALVTTGVIWEDFIGSAMTDVLYNLKHYKKRLCGV